jgi:hypothetical protein
MLRVRCAELVAGAVCVLIRMWYAVLAYLHDIEVLQECLQGLLCLGTVWAATNQQDTHV